jgi:hypothetical protein
MKFKVRRKKRGKRHGRPSKSSTPTPPPAAKRNPVMNNPEIETEPQRFLGLSHFDWAIIVPVFLIVVGIFGSVPIKAANDLYKVNKHGHVVVASAPAEVSDP